MRACIKSSSISLSSDVHERTGDDFSPKRRGDRRLEKPLRFVLRLPRTVKRMSKRNKWWKELLAGGAGLAALATVNFVAARRRKTADPPAELFGGEVEFYGWRHGGIIYRLAGLESTPPVVFVHAIMAGASSFMWRRNFAALAERFRVYAPDLLGFGFSDKPPTAPYSADLYVELLSDFLRDVVRRPAHLVASSLSAAYAVRVADERPEFVLSLTLVSPLGIDAFHERPGMTGAAFYGLLHSPVLGTSFYNVIASERSLRDHAHRYLYYDRDMVTPRLVAHHYAMSHQPGAQHAMTAFLSGYLNCDVRANFARLIQPATLIWGREDRSNPPARAGIWLRLNPRARVVVFDRARLMVQEEQAEAFNTLLHEEFARKSAVAA